VVIQDHDVDTRTDTGAQANRLANGPVRPIVAPLWLGAERRGVDLGAISLERGLRNRWERRGNLTYSDRLLPSIEIAVAEPPDADSRLDCQSLEFLPEIAEVCRRLRPVVRDSIERGELALILGGDHALAAGSIAGAVQTTEKLGVLWFDTHADLNTPETSPSGHIHGMPLAAALGHRPVELMPSASSRALDPAAVCLLGVRDLDFGERQFIAENDIWTLTMEEWTDIGLLPGLEAALHHLRVHKTTGIHLSFDLDVLDPLELPGTGTPVPGGLSFCEASQVLRSLRAWDGPIRSVDWVELNPTLDPSGRSTLVAVTLLATLLGETVR
jgi:arginase